MKRSILSTSAIRETYTFRLEVVQWRPNSSHAFVKISLMSPDRFENAYRGWRQLRPVFMNRHPSE